MGLPGPTELIIIAGVVVLLFGATKLPKLGGAIGESIKNFKRGIKDDSNNEKIADASEPAEGKRSESEPRV